MPKKGIPDNIHWRIYGTTLLLICFIINLTALGYALINSHYLDSSWKTSRLLDDNSPDRNINPDKKMTWRFYNFFPNKRIILHHYFKPDYGLATKEDGVSTRSILEHYKNQPMCSVIIEGKGYKEKYTCDSIMELRRQGDYWKYKDLKSQDQIQELSSEGVTDFILPRGYYTVTVIPNANFIREMITHDDSASFWFTVGAYRWHDFPEKKARELFGKRPSPELSRFVAGESRMLHELGNQSYRYSGKGFNLILEFLVHSQVMIAGGLSILFGILFILFGTIFFISFKRRLKDESNIKPGP